MFSLSSQDEDVGTKSRLPLTAESLDTRGLYIFDDGFRFVVWFGRSLSPDIARNLVGEDFASDFSKVKLVTNFLVDSVLQLVTCKWNKTIVYMQVSLLQGENKMSRKLMEILNECRKKDPSYYQLCHVVRQGEQPREGFFLLTNLVEDAIGGVNGYPDWMLLLYRQVQQNA